MNSEILLIPSSCGKHEIGALEDSVLKFVLSDQDFESAIGLLEASTASIERQCRLLEAQRQALQDIRARNASNKPNEDVKSHRNDKLTRERAKLDFEIDELISSLRGRLSASVKQGPGASGSIQSNVERALEKDDRLLDGLEKIIPHSRSQRDGSANSEEVERLCQALTVQSGAEIRSQIEAVYFAGSKVNAAQSNASHADGVAADMQQQRELLQAELDELCREIDGLSTMAVDSRYRHPISRALETAKANSEMERATWSEYFSATIQYLAARLDTINDHFRDTEAHTSALKTTSITLECLLSVKADPKQESHVGTQSPTKQLQRGLKPLRLVQANLSDTHDPTSQLLRCLDIHLADAKKSAKLSERLTAAMNEKSENLSALFSASEQGVSDQVAGSIGKADGDVHALLAALHAQSKISTVNMIDEGIQSGIDNLEQQTQKQSDEMRELDMDEIVKMIRVKQQALLNERRK